MSLNSKQKQQSIMYVLIGLIMLVIVTFWFFSTRYKIDEIKTRPAENLIENIKAVIDKKEIGEDIKDIKETWDKREEFQVPVEDVEARLNTETEEDEESEITKNEIKTIEDKLQKYQK